MDQELGEMHWKDGWMFKRLENGDVRIRKVPTRSPQDAAVPEQQAIIPAAEWVSLIHHVGRNQDVEHFEQARVFHGGAEK